MSDQLRHEPYGPADNGGAARILPVALAYRDAPPDVLEGAISEALTFSHSHPVGMDAGRVAAAAVIWLCKHSVASEEGDGPSSSSSSASLPSETFPVIFPGMRPLRPGPRELLRHLKEVAQTDEMKVKLMYMEARGFNVDAMDSWRSIFAISKTGEGVWTLVLANLERLTFHGQASTGSETVAASLLALITCWNEPERIVEMAASFGGSGVPVVAQLAGAFAGALHGDRWIPRRWWTNLENTPRGQDKRQGKSASTGDEEDTYDKLEDEWGLIYETNEEDEESLQFLSAEKRRLAAQLWRMGPRDEVVMLGRELAKMNCMAYGFGDE